HRRRLRLRQRPPRADDRKGRGQGGPLRHRALPCRPGRGRPPRSLLVSPPGQTVEPTRGRLAWVEPTHGRFLLWGGRRADRGSALQGKTGRLGFLAPDGPVEGIVPGPFHQCAADGIVEDVARLVEQVLVPAEAVVVEALLPEPSRTSPQPAQFA